MQISPMSSGKEDGAGAELTGRLVVAVGMTASGEALAWSVGDALCAKGASSGGYTGSALSDTGILTAGLSVFLPLSGE